MIFRKITLALSAFTVMVCGCRTTIEKAHHAQHPENQRPGERTIQAKEIHLEGGKVMELKELEDVAVRYQPDVIQAQEALASAELAVWDANAGKMPSLTGSLGHSRSTANADRHHQSTRNSGKWNGSLSLNWTIYDFGKTDLAVAQAISKVRAAEQELRSAQSTAIYNVRTAFFQVRRCVELDKVAVEAVEQYKEHLEQVRVKKEVGKASPYDLTKAEVDWNSAVLAQITTAHNVENAWCDLNKALGLAESPDYRLGEGSMQEYELDTDKLMELACKKEPVLSSLCAKAQAASLYVDKTIADLYPTLALSFGGSVSGRNTSLPWLWNLTGAASLTETFFDGGNNLRKVDEAVLTLRQARTQVAAKQQELYQKIRKAVLVAQKAQKQLEVSSLEERLAKQNLDIVNEQFKVGKASSVERTDAQVSHSKARANVVTATHDRQDALASIAYLTGDFRLPGEIVNPGAVPQAVPQEKGEK